MKEISCEVIREEKKNEKKNNRDVLRTNDFNSYKARVPCM